MQSLYHYLRLIGYKSLLTFGLRRASVRTWHSPGPVVAPGGVPPRGPPEKKADASRRRNGPRKATSCRLITVRLRSKSCLAGRYRVSRVGRRAVVAIEAANPSAGECGVEDQVGRASAAPLDERAKFRPKWGSRWRSSSRDVNSPSRHVSVSTLSPNWPGSRS